MSSEQGSKKLTLRAVSSSEKNIGVRFYIDGTEAAFVDNPREKAIEIQQGNHNIYAQSPFFKSNVLNFTVTDDIAIIAIHHQAKEQLKCELDFPSLDVASLEAEKEALERTISNTGMKIGTLFTYIFVVLIFACLAWFIGFYIIGQDAVLICLIPLVMIIGIALFGLILQFNRSNNKSFWEERLRELNRELATRKTNNTVKKNSMVNNPAEILPSETQDVESELRKIKKLKDDELISEDEYKELRKKVMDKFK